MSLSDKAALDAIYEAGKNALDDMIRQYADATVAIADIKVAVRAQKTGKSAEFMRRALAPCDSINVEQLIKAALSGMGCNTGSILQARHMQRARRPWKRSPVTFERSV